MTLPAGSKLAQKLHMREFQQQEGCMRITLLSGFAFALLAAPAAASVTITFDEIDNIAGNVFPAGATYLSPQGFRFTNSFGGTGGLLVWQRSLSFNADPDGATMSHNFSSTTTTVVAEDGSLFDLTSIDFADVYNDASGGTFQMGWTFADDSTGGGIYTLDNLIGLQTFSFNVTGIKSFTILPVATLGNWIQFDNVVLNGGGGAVVPEPATWAMMIAGFGLVGAAARRRRTAPKLLVG
jgi:hypothetical protein